MNDTECVNPECQKVFAQTDDGENLCPDCEDDYEICPQCGHGQANYKFLDDDTSECYDLCEECREEESGDDE